MVEEISKEKFDEKIEADSFDDAITKEYENLKDEDLIFPEQSLCSYLNVTSAPVISYRYAIYLLKESEIINQNILNVACGTGEEAVILAKKGANVFASDISPISVRVAQKRACLNSVADRIHAEVMSVYNLKFPDASFKYIYGNACLHHFDLEKAILEMYRVLKPGGIGIFREPVGNSRILQKIRDFIPIKKDIVSPNERQLTYEDINIIKTVFKNVVVKEFGLFIRLNRIIKNEKINAFIYKIDNILLEKFPYLRKYSCRVVIQFIK